MVEEQDLNVGESLAEVEYTPAKKSTTSYFFKRKPKEEKKRGPGRPRTKPKSKKPKRPVGRPKKKSLKVIQRIPNPRRELTVTQGILRDLFADKNQIWNNGSNPVTINRTLSTGNGIIKSGDNGQTARMFGGFR